MKKITNLSRLIVSSLLVLATPVFALISSPKILNCNIVNIAPNQWRATFTINYELTNADTETTDNRITAIVPQVNSSTGKPVYNQLATAGYSNLTMSGTAMKGSFNSTTLTLFGTGSNPLVTTVASGSAVSIDFSTANNNAYPVLFVRMYNSQLSGGNTFYVSNYAWVTSSGCALGSTLPPTLPPIDEINPPEPEFSLQSAVWELNTVDIGDLPNVADNGTGFSATIKNVASNNLCLSYTTAGVKNKNYALKVTNTTSTLGGRNVLSMQGIGSVLPYTLQLASNDGNTSNNFDFPTASNKYITLSQAASSVDKRSQMCWTPKVNLFKNSETKAGIHTDTVNFLISPQA